MDRYADLESAHNQFTSRNPIYRQNKAVHEYFSSNENARKYFMLNGIAHQTFFMISMLVCCGYLVNNQFFMFILLEQENIHLIGMMLVFTFFCLFCIFCTRSLRYDRVIQADNTTELSDIPEFCSLLLRYGHYTSRGLIVH